MTLSVANVINMYEWPNCCSYLICPFLPGGCLLLRVPFEPFWSRWGGGKIKMCAVVLHCQIAGFVWVCVCVCVNLRKIPVSLFLSACFSLSSFTSFPHHHVSTHCLSFFLKWTNMRMRGRNLLWQIFERIHFSTFLLATLQRQPTYTDVTTFL